jgi:hypothetical protein
MLRSYRLIEVIGLILLIADSITFEVKVKPQSFGDADANTFFVVVGVYQQSVVDV